MGDASVVDQDVDPAEALDGGCDQRLAVGRRAHVTADGERISQRRSQFDVGVMPARGQNDARASRIEHASKALAEAG